jgi:hypothetical protein
METADAKTLAESALDTLAAQLEAGRSASLTSYLAAMARFHRYSALCDPQHSRLNVFSPTM